MMNMAIYTLAVPGYCVGQLVLYAVTGPWKRKAPRTKT